MDAFARTDEEIAQTIIDRIIQHEEKSTPDGYYYFDQRFDEERFKRKLLQITKPKKRRAKYQQQPTNQWDTNDASSSEDEDDVEYFEQWERKRKRRPSYQMVPATALSPELLQKPHFSLHIVPTNTTEFTDIELAAGNDEYASGCRLVGMLQIQNHILFQRFQQRLQGQEPYLRIGFHGSKYNEFLPLILNEGFDPKKSERAEYGYGSYFGRNVRHSVEAYSGMINTPIYRSASDLKRDQYKIVILALCNVGKPLYTTARGHRRRLPDDEHGAFVDSAQDPSIFCIQDAARIYPAYVLVYKSLRNSTDQQQTDAMSIAAEDGHAWSLENPELPLNVFQHAWSSAAAALCDTTWS